MSPELVTGVVFGVVMFFLGVIALWQNRQRRHRQGSSPSTQIQGHLTSVVYQSHDGIYQPQTNGAFARSQNYNGIHLSQDNSTSFQNQGPRSMHRCGYIDASVRRQGPNMASRPRTTDVSAEAPGLSVADSSQGDNASVPQQGLDPVGQYRDTGTSDRVAADFAHTQGTEDTDAPDQFRPVRASDIV